MSGAVISANQSVKIEGVTLSGTDAGPGVYYTAFTTSANEYIEIDYLRLQSSAAYTANMQILHSATNFPLMTISLTLAGGAGVFQSIFSRVVQESFPGGIAAPTNLEPQFALDAQKVRVLRIPPNCRLEFRVAHAGVATSTWHVFGTKYINSP